MEIASADSASHCCSMRAKSSEVDSDGLMVSASAGAIGVNVAVQSVSSQPKRDE